MTVLLDLELTSRLCLTLLHSLWQVALLAFIVWGLDRTLRSLSLAHRYTLHLGVLVLAIAALPVTFLLTEAPSISNVPQATAIEAPDIPASTPLVSQDIRPDDTSQAVTSLSQPPMPPVVGRLASDLPATPIPQVNQPTASVEPAPPWWIGLTPWIAAVYAIGVLMMLARLLLCVGRTQRLKATATPITDGPLVEHLRHLSNQLKIRVTPVLAQAERIVVPQIVGLLRPTILLPTAAINGLSLDDLEMILLHELAHVRRHDMWVNLLQRLAEVVLFFNPALWYLSRRISSLREYCCDEITCRTSTSDDAAHRTRYATALVRVAELSQTTRRSSTTNELTTLAASGRTPSELRRRIAYLLGEPMNEPLGLSRGTIMTVVVIAISAFVWWSAAAQTADQSTVASETTEDEFPATFSCGAKAMVVAIGSQDDDPAEWWNSRGVPLESVDFKWIEARNFTKQNQQWRRMLVQVTDVPDDSEVRCDFVKSRNDWGASVEFAEEEADSDRTFAKTFAVSDDEQSIGVRLGVAAGPWNSTSKFGVTGTEATGRKLKSGGQLSIVSSGAIPTDGGTMIVISHNDFEHNLRVVAIDKNGKLHDSTGRGGTSAGNIYQIKPMFPGLAPDDIDHFEFQTRDYEWVEINDLPLHPNDGDKTSAVVPERTLHFPGDRVMGVVYTRPAEGSDFGFRGNWYADWTQIGEARGEVEVPAGQHVRLDISHEASVDLTPLAQLAADDIDAIWLRGTDVTDDQLQHISHLSGLKHLDLEQCKITDAGAGHLVGLQQLERLDLSAFSVDREGFGVGDEAMTVVAQLPSLESIDLRLSKVTDEGLANLAKCLSLRNVGIEGTAVTDGGLEHLLKLPHLKWLSLGVYDEGTNITDEGLRTLAMMPQLEILNLSGTQITNEGLKHLAPLVNLERLDIDNTQITEEGFVHLANLKSLENLRFYKHLHSDVVTDVGAKHLSKVTSLKRISTDTVVTDAGVADLAKLPHLEELMLDGEGVTDESLVHIARIPNLKRLWFQSCNVSDRGLARLRNSQSLEYVLISDTQMTTTGLQHFMTMANLKILDLNLREDEAADWSTLKWFSQLDELRLSGPGIHNSDLTHIQGLTQLTGLVLDLEDPLDDEGMAALQPLTKLKNVRIDSSIVTDEGLKALSDKPDLEYLTISCLATDTGIHAFDGLQSLRHLQIASLFLTDGGLAALSERLPSLQTLNHYDYRLDHTDISASPHDAFFRRGEPEGRPPQDALERKAPPPLTVKNWLNIEGDSLSLDDLKGKVVLVQFWEERLGWSHIQMPIVHELYDEFHDQGLEIIGLHSPASANDLQFAIDKHGIQWPVCTDINDQTANAWQVKHHCGHYLLDRNGTLRYADIFPGHLDDAVKALLAENRTPPADDEATPPTENTPSPDEDTTAEDTVDMRVVVARHVMLLEGKEIITWEQLEAKIAALPDPSLAHPHLYVTRGATEAGKYDPSKEQMWRLHREYKLTGHSEGSLWPRTDWRYDSIETAEDLIPDEALRIDGTIVDSDGNPVEGAEVILVTPVDESISYKSYHIALVEGRVRNTLEHVLTHSDRDGQFAYYPPKETPYYVLALHPEHGIALMNDQTFAEKQELSLLDWSGLVVGLSEESEKQQADLRTRVKEYGGRPEIEFNQYWSDLKKTDPTLEFGFSHIPPIWETSVSRSFENPDGGSTGVSGASVGLLPGETRRLDLGPITEQQREHLKSIRTLMERREKPVEEPQDETSQTNEPWKVRLKAIDQATGEALPNATFEVGRLYEESEKNTRTDYSADDDGTFVAEFETRTPEVCVLSCRAEGYTPVHGRWVSPELSEEGEPLPEELTFPLQRGITVGGIVLNEDEEPVSGATVKFSSSNFGVESGAKLVQAVEFNEFVTDEQGRWSCDYAPAEMTDASITVNHEDSSADDTNYGIGKRVDELKLQQLVYYLRRPRKVYGQVTGPDGEPIEDALITVGVYPEQDDPTFRTDAQGHYSIEGLLIDRITVIKPEFAPAEHIFSDWPDHPFEREIEGADAEGELNIQLQPGVTVEIHVTDKDGKSLENAKVTPKYWETGSEFRGNRFFYTKLGEGFLTETTDQDGRWRWTWAPRGDVLKFVVSHSGYVTVHNVPFTADKTRQTFTVKLDPDPSQPHILVGWVVDSLTRRPIKDFVVQRGRTTGPGRRPANPNLNPERYGNGDVFWPPGSRIPGKDGRFLTNITVPFEEGKYVYRVLADGYETAMSEPVMNNDGVPVLTFQLSRTQ